MPRVEHPRAEKAVERILDAAQELFAQIGFDATKMEQIAKHAGVSRQTVYQYSVSKDEIYRLVLARAAERYLHALENIDEEQDPRKILSDVASAMLDEYLGSSQLFLMDVSLHGHIVPPPIVRETGLAYRDMIDRALTRGKELGIFHASARAYIFQAHAMALLAGFGFSRRLLTLLADVDCVSSEALVFWKNYLTSTLLMTVEREAYGRIAGNGLSDSIFNRSGSNPRELQ
jgi:AcrR family transcriptional regulator